MNFDFPLCFFKALFGSVFVDEAPPKTMTGSIPASFTMVIWLSDFKEHADTSHSIAIQQVKIFMSNSVGR